MISVTIITKNAEETLEATLEALKPFPEVLILDSGSVDTTLEIAEKFPNVKVYKREFLGFGKTHNLASSEATHDWILSIDSDEILTPQLSDEILKLVLDPICAYALQRHNFFRNKQIKYCGGWHPDWVVRLYNRKKTQFSDVAVHEKVLTVGMRVVRLTHPLLHTPYRQIGDFLAKMQTYSTLFAEQHQKKKSSSLLKAIAHGWLAFFKSYVLKRGIFGGREGLILSLYNGHATYYKYLKLEEINRKD